MKVPLVLKLFKALKNDCEGTECPGGCCPYQNWACCPDMTTCAATLDDC